MPVQQALVTFDKVEAPNEEVLKWVLNRTVGQCTSETERASRFNSMASATFYSPPRAYAVHAGNQQADVSATVFPIWGYTAAGAPEMRAMMTALERNHSWRGLLYCRTVGYSDAQEEEPILVGTQWVAQYWVGLCQQLRTCSVHSGRGIGIRERCRPVRGR